MKIKDGWSITACVVFFIVGVIVGRNWFMFPAHTTNFPQSTRSNSLTLDIPQVPLPPDWLSKEDLAGNSFKTAFSLSPGIQTQGTINDNNAIDYYFFALKNPSQIVINVTNVPKALYWVLYDDKFNEVTSTYRKGAIQGSTQVALQNPGKYYIKVWADYHAFTNYPYTIRLTILPYFE